MNQIHRVDYCYEYGNQSVLDEIPGFCASRREFGQYFFTDYDGVICFNLLFVQPEYFKDNADRLIEALKQDSLDVDEKNKIEIFMDD